jgi:hypothetical protein
MSIDNDPLGASTRRKKWPKYKGELGNPINVNKERLDDAFLRKCGALAQFYGINPEPTSDYILRLFICLARHHVPGFRLREPRKTPSNKIWTDDILEELYTDVEKIKSQNGFTQDREAYDYIATHRPYSAKWRKVFKKDQTRRTMKENLESRYQDARRKRDEAEALYKEMLVAALMKPVPSEPSR